VGGREEVKRVVGLKEESDLGQEVFWGVDSGFRNLKEYGRFMLGLV